NLQIKLRNPGKIYKSSRNSARIIRPPGGILPAYLHTSTYSKGASVSKRRLRQISLQRVYNLLSRPKRNPAYQRYLDILKRYNGRVSRITHERFVEWQVAERKFAPAIHLIRATVFPNPPRTVNSLIIALTSAQGSLKLLDYNVDQSLSTERAAQLKREVVIYLQDKVDEAANKKGKEKEQTSIGSTSSKASNDEYHTPEPEFKFGPLGAADAEERASELSALESLQQRALLVYKDLQALEREVNLDTNEIPDQTIPNVDALLDYIAPLNNPVENEEFEAEPENQLPDQGQKGNNDQTEDEVVGNQDNQESDRENPENQADDAEASQPPTRAPTPEPDNQNPPLNLPPVANPPVANPPAPPANPPIPPAPPVQADDEEMSQATYPVFDGTNPRKWLGEMEIAFTANNIQANAHERRIGLAVLNSGPAKMWYIMLAAKPTTWERANNLDGFKELFLDKYANDDNRAQASQLAFMRTQRLGETVGQYYNALQEQWMECGDGVIPEWMKVNKFVHGLIPAIREPVMQQAPTTIADAVKVATQCYNAFQTNVQPSHTATDTALQALMATMQENYNAHAITQSNGRWNDEKLQRLSTLALEVVICLGGQDEYEQLVEIKRKLDFEIMERLISTVNGTHEDNEVDHQIKKRKLRDLELEEDKCQLEELTDFALDIIGFECRYVNPSVTSLALKMREDDCYDHIGNDFSFLENLDAEETRKVDEKFNYFETNDPPNPQWTDERLVFAADHYLTYRELSQYCDSSRTTIDFTKNWAFEDKSGWQSAHTNKAALQCYEYSSKFFIHDKNNRRRKYISIMTDSRKYRLWYAFWNDEQRQMNVRETADFAWSQECETAYSGRDTLRILARVFKTFITIDLRAAASPRNFGNIGSTKDISSMASYNSGFNILFDRRARTEALYEMLVEHGLPFVTTADGDIKASRLLGLGSDTVIFEARTVCNERVALKFSFGFTSEVLERESQALKILKDVKDIPKLLYEDFDSIRPYIVTNMVGRKINKVDVPIACHIIADILQILKVIHEYGYIHNDIHPGNIVNVNGKYRLIDFGLAVPRFDKRENVPSDWPEGNIVFASHNRGKYLGAADDLEALSYTIAFMYNQNKAYWQIATKDPCQAIHQKERKLTYLFDGLPQVFRDFFEYVYDLEITVTPDYEYWQDLFQETAETRCFRPSKHFPETSQESPNHSLESKRGVRRRIEQQAW
ncbi:3806_t:CDS:2, partial [Paraglomus brasilianum]